MLLVERYLTHTVDGVVSMVHYLRHTVLSTLHHHAATEDTAEVGTLDGIHQTSCIDRQYSVLLPVTRSRIGVNRTVAIEHGSICCRTLKERIDIISC